MRHFNHRTSATLIAAVALPFLSLSANASPTVYMQTAPGGPFGTINLGTGAFTAIGTPTVGLSGLGEYGGTVYAGSYLGDTATLYTVDTSTGAVTPVGAPTTLPGGMDLFGSTLSGLYGISYTNADLYSFNPTTGAATLIGPTGAPVTGTTGLSDNSGALYYSSGYDVYSVNTTTGAATELGAMGGGIELGALIQIGGVEYAGEDSPAVTVDTLNITDGAATVGSAVTGTGSTFWGLAVIPQSTPDAMPMWILGPVLAALAAVRRKLR